MGEIVESSYNRAIRLENESDEIVEGLKNASLIGHGMGGFSYEECTICAQAQSTSYLRYCVDEEVIHQRTYISDWKRACRVELAVRDSLDQSIEDMLSG